MVVLCSKVCTRSCNQESKLSDAVVPVPVLEKTVPTPTCQLFESNCLNLVDSINRMQRKINNLFAKLQNDCIFYPIFTDNLLVFKHRHHQHYVAIYEQVG